MKKIIVMLAVISTASFAQTLAPDQNPNYMNSQEYYSKNYRDYTKTEGTTIQPKISEKPSLKEQKEANRHLEKMARITARSNRRQRPFQMPMYNSPLQINPNTLMFGLLGAYLLTR